jgi:hypothetical protein
MRRIDDTPLDPEIAAQLDAIDATLAGDPVDPQYAELAELALLLTAERPSVDLAFASSLDERVARRFAGDGSRRFVSPAADGDIESGSRWRRLWGGDWLAPMAGLLAGCVGIVVAVIVFSGGGGSMSGPSTTPVSGFASSGAGSSAGSAASSAGVSTSAAQTQKTLAPEASHGAARSSAASATTSSSAAATPAPPAPTASGAVGAAGVSSAASSAAGSVSVQPPGNGRKIAQSAQLALGTAPEHIDDVSQEVFDVAGRERAVVNSSNVTAGAGGYAEFQLSVPSASLAATMTALSQLQYATVNSRTDSSQDVNGQYLYDNRKLRDDQALRSSLLKQLGNATTQTQIDSLNARIHDAEGAITKDEAILRGLNHKIDFSPVTVTINQAAVPVGTGHSGNGHSGSSFTLGKAAHDAGRVITVVAGVALITLAALVPVALIAALAWWIASSVRRRRREQALDLA